MRLFSSILLSAAPTPEIWSSVSQPLGEFIAPTPSSLCNVRIEAPVGDGGGIQLFRPSPFQVQMLGDLRSDVRNRVSSWMGLAAPMQTGKSKLIGPIIRMLREEMGEDTRIIVLSSGRIITKQLMEDLTEQFGEAIARFDGLVKNRPKLLTVASVWSMANHLDTFPPGVRTVLINDEAFSTQSDTIRALYTHFGLGEIREEGGSSYLRPCAGNGLVIGFSGTGGGLEGYHVSGHLDLLSAIESGLIRHLRGDRIVLKIPSEQRRIYGEGRMIWWEPTKENAAILADIYKERIYPHYRKNLVYVPTIEHGRLLTGAMKEKCDKKHSIHFVHSDTSEMSDTEFLKAVAGWEKGGGALISINRMARGYRATGTDSVFHTYQSDSPELFANRTGRAWGRGDPWTNSSMPDLYVLEATWNPRGTFANLARLLGLIDYPGTGLATRRLRSEIKDQEGREKRRRSLMTAVGRGEVDAVFVGIPLLESWRQALDRILKKSGGVTPLAEKTDLSVETIAGFALGALPVRWAEAEALQSVLGGRQKAARIWVESWSQVVDEILGGRAKLTDQVESELFAWRDGLRTDDRAGLMTAVASLNVILENNLSFLKAKPFQKRRDIPVTEADRAVLRENGGPVEMIANDGIWRRIWQGLAQDAREKGDRKRFDTLMGHFFQREGWERDSNTAQGRLLAAAREGVSLKYRGLLAMNHGIEGVSSTGEYDVPLILRWIEGRLDKSTHNFSYKRYYDEVRALLIHIGVSKPKAEALVTAAIFEERQWSFGVRNERERLKREVRVAVAVQLGGNLSKQLYRDEAKGTIGIIRPKNIVPVDDEPHFSDEDHDEALRTLRRREVLEGNTMTTSRLADWLNAKGEDWYPYTLQTSPLEFYQEVVTLMEWIGADPERFLPAVHSALAEELEAAEDRGLIQSLLAVRAWMIQEHPSRGFRESGSIAGWIEDFKESLNAPEGADQDSEAKELSRKIKKALYTLTPREEKVLKMRFGITEKSDFTLAEIAQDFEVTSERIRGIEGKGLRKLRHPARSRLLKEFVVPPSFGKPVSTVTDQRILSLLSTVPDDDPMPHLELGEEDPRPLNEWELGRVVLEYYDSLKPSSVWGDRICRHLFRACELALKYKAIDDSKKKAIIRAVTREEDPFIASLVQKHFQSLRLFEIHWGYNGTVSGSEWRPLKGIFVEEER